MDLVKKLFAPLMFLIFAIFKFGKYILMVLKFGKFGSLITMLVSVWAYSLYFGWPFAVGFVLLIFVHELGHALVLRKEGIASGLPVFIPFLGAFITMKDMPRNAWVEAKVGIGGPLLGTIGAAVVLAMAHSTLAGQVSDAGLLGSLQETAEPLSKWTKLFFALAQTGFLINLFNMIPVSPMDGGRIAGGVSKWFLLIGLVIGAYCFFLLRSPLLLIMLVLGGMTTWQTFKNPIPGYFDIPTEKKLTMGLAYVTLLCILFYSYQHCRPYLASVPIEQQAVIWGSSAMAALVGFGNKAQ